jgi:hypothetical protein
MTCFSEERELFNIFPDRQRFLQEKNFWWKISFCSCPPGHTKQCHFRAMPAPTGNGTR